MRPAAILLPVFVVYGLAANAQFSLQPQFGLENPFTKVSYNDGTFFRPASSQLSPKFSLRLNYQSKLGHGLFLGLSSSRTGIGYSFSNPDKGATAYTVSRNEMQIGFEGGYQFSTKPIFFKRQSSIASVPAVTPAHRCGQYAAVHHCGEKAVVANASKANTGLSVRLQPSVGVAYIPFAPSKLSSNTQAGQTSYTYNAGMKTGLLTGAAFAFGKGERSLFTLSVNYFKSLGNNQAQLLTQVAGKDVVTQMRTSISGWNASLGLPLSFSKTKQAVKPAPQIRTEIRKYDCQHHYRCGGRAS